MIHVQLTTTWSSHTHSGRIALNFKQELTQSPGPYPDSMINVFTLFDQGKFGDGKFCWPQQFSGQFDFVKQAIVDVWGNEDLFMSQVGASLRSSF